MADKLGLGNEVRELKIGQSFTNPRSTAFHTVKYDFKPASVDPNKKASLDISQNNQVTVTVPHLDGSGTAQTVFKGSQKPYTKECVLVIDRVTGEITLEKLACNIQVKKTRSEINRPPLNQDRLNQQSSSSNGKSSNSLHDRSATPPTVGHRVSNKTRVTSGSRRPDRPITQLVPKHSPLRASPNPNQKSPLGRSSLHNNDSCNNPSILASLPMIGMDDFSADAAPAPQQQNSNSRLEAPSIANKPSLSPVRSDTENGVGTISDSSSSSSDSDSDSDNAQNASTNAKPTTNGFSNSNGSMKANNANFLNEDLCLSESGSESDD